MSPVKLGPNCFPSNGADPAWAGDTKSVANLLESQQDFDSSGCETHKSSTNGRERIGRRATVTAADVQMTPDRPYHSEAESNVDLMSLRKASEVLGPSEIGWLSRVPCGLLILRRTVTGVPTYASWFLDRPWHKRQPTGTPG